MHPPVRAASFFHGLTSHSRSRLSHQLFAPHQENECKMYPESVEVNGIIFAQLYLALWIKTAHFLQQMGNFGLTNCYPKRPNKQNSKSLQVQSNPAIGSMCG